MAKLNTRYGILDVPDQQNDLIGRFLDQFGEWAWDETRFVASILPDNARVLDAGAFIGTFALGLSMNANPAFLCCVEGNPAVTPALEANLRRNAKCPAEVVNALLVPLANMQGTPEPSRNNLGGTTFSVSMRETYGPEAVSSVTLAELEDRFGQFDLIKLDIEGMELDVLSANATRLREGNTTLWVECNESEDALKLGKLLLSWKLDIHYISFPSYNPDNFKSNPVAIFPMAYEAGLLVSSKKQPIFDRDAENHRCFLTHITDLDTLKSALWDTPRWAKADWIDAPREKLIAWLSHSWTDSTYYSFLTKGRAALNHIKSIEDDAAPGLWDLSDKRIQALMLSYRAELVAGRNRIEALESEIGYMQAQLSQKMSDDTEELRTVTMAALEKSNRRNEFLEERDHCLMTELQGTKALLAETVMALARAETERQALLTSASWRLMGPLRRAALRSAILHRTLLRLRNAGGKLKRWVAA